MKTKKLARAPHPATKYSQTFCRLQLQRQGRWLRKYVPSTYRRFRAQLGLLYQPLQLCWQCRKQEAGTALAGLCVDCRYPVQICLQPFPPILLVSAAW